jgi:caa(3)-type oxidase subunit IV
MAAITNHSDPTHENNHGIHHVQPIRMYLFIFFWLLLFMFLTIAVAKIPALHIGPPNVQIWNNLVAIGIASFKVFLVVGYFMHAKFGSPLVKTYAVLGFAWVTLLGLIFGDYLTRSWESVEGWERVPASALPATPGVANVNPAGPAFGSYGSPVQEEHLKRYTPNIQHPNVLPKGSTSKKPTPAVPITSYPVPARPTEPPPKQLPPIRIVE